MTALVRQSASDGNGEGEQHPSALERKPRWRTSDAAEFVNSLCPNTQFDFPAFEWCNQHERAVLKDCCATAFTTIKQAWLVGEIERIHSCTKNELKVLAVINLKTLRFNKLFEAIPRRFFTIGQHSNDLNKQKYYLGFDIIPASGTTKGSPTTGISDGKLSEAISKMRAIRYIGCVEADKRNGNKPTKIYCVDTMARVCNLFLICVKDSLDTYAKKGSFSVDHGNSLYRRFRAEFRERCLAMVEEDESGAAQLIAEAERKAAAKASR